MQKSPSPGDNDLANSVLSKLCPLLKVVANSDPTAPRNQALETALTGFSSMARLPWGAEVAPEVAADPKRPEKPIVIYEFEACPFCRRVRELVTYLDLEVEIRPCPKGSIRHRNEVADLGGKQLFPFMKDPNTGTSLYGTSALSNPRRGYHPSLKQRARLPCRERGHRRVPATGVRPGRRDASRAPPVHAPHRLGSDAAPRGPRYVALGWRACRGAAGAAAALELRK